MTPPAHLTAAPTIVTDRLVLRGYTVADFDAMVAMWTDPAVVAELGGQPRTGEDTWARLLRQIGHWAALGYGVWAITDRESGAYLGSSGISRFERAVPEAVVGEYEASWALVGAAHGKGYAGEAMRAVLAWFDAAFPATPTACMIRASNVGSLKLAAKLGYVASAEGTHLGTPITIFRRPAPTPAPSPR